MGVRGFVAGLAALVAGCASLDGPQQVLVIARGDDGHYGLHPREVVADDLRALRGEQLEFVAQPTVVFSDGAATLHGGHALDVDYARDGDRLVPLDNQGLVAVSAYHHLTQAAAYFRQIGLPSDLARVKTLYQPFTDYGGTVGPYEYHDNAAYVPSIHAFMLLEERYLDYVPLAANEGVMAHEFAHAVFQSIAGSAHPDWDRVSYNLWRSINEGLADIHAIALTGDPAFAQASAGRFVVERDVSGSGATLTEELYATTGDELYNPYPIGTVFAAVFWDYREALVALGRDPAAATRQMGELALRSLVALEITPSGFQLADLASAAVAEAGSEGATLCESLAVRADLIMAEVQGCP